jgi:taurine dioxygenase
MQHEVLHPIGARVTGLSVADVGPDDVDALARLLAEHGVLVIPGQEDVDDTAFVAFLKAFGPMAFTKGEAHAPGFPDLNVVSNVGRTTPPRSSFHVDTSYVAEPPAYTALRAVTIPAQGGETLFTNQRRAYETLDPALRERLEGRTIRHVVTGVTLEPGDEAAAEHPVFRPHPTSGEVSLYLTTPARCAAISGMDDAEAADVVAALFAHSTAPENTLRHAWSPGDVVMWDNARVLHAADHSGVVGDRVMHRGMVAAHR